MSYVAGSAPGGTQGSGGSCSVGLPGGGAGVGTVVLELTWLSPLVIKRKAMLGALQRARSIIAALHSMLILDNILLRHKDDRKLP